MNRLMIAFATALCAFSILAQQVGQSVAVDGKEVDSHGKVAKENPYEKWLRTTGGTVFQKDSEKGKVVFVDTGSFLAAEDYEKVIAFLEKMDMFYRYEFVKDSVPSEGVQELKSKHGATVLVAFYADPKAPIMTAAPEDSWAAINVPKIYEGLTTDGAKKKFAAQRLRKEALRAFAYACGCGGSGFPGNVLATSTVKDLDYVDEIIPFDALQNMKKIMVGRGLTLRRKTTYRKACREGWAHSPTNDIEKAIWDKVHEIPTKPIKIEYNEKRDKGK